MIAQKRHTHTLLGCLGRPVFDQSIFCAKQVFALKSESKFPEILLSVRSSKSAEIFAYFQF